jgi:hypothetical protein
MVHEYDKVVRKKHNLSNGVFLKTSQSENSKVPNLFSDEETNIITNNIKTTNVKDFEKNKTLDNNVPNLFSDDE